MWLIKHNWVKRAFTALKTALGGWVKNIFIQPYLRDTVGLVPDHCNKTIFVLKEGLSVCKKTKQNKYTSLRCSKAKHSKMRYAFKR